MKPTLVVLAAGMGSRYGGLKQMDEFGPNGEAIIDYSIYDAIEAGFGKVVFIIREHFKEAFQNFFEGKFEGQIEIEYAAQELDLLPEGYRIPEGREKPWGTAHAIYPAKDFVNEPFLVINADDFYGRAAYVEAVKHFNKWNEATLKEKEIFLLAYFLKNTLSDHGAVNRGVCFLDEAKNLVGIKECLGIHREADGSIHYEASEDDKVELSLDSVVSMNMWGFTPAYFDYFEKGFKTFLTNRGSELKSEYYIPDIVEELMIEDKIDVGVLYSDAEWFGVTYKDDKPHVQKRLNQLIADGVYPQKLWG